MRISDWSSDVCSSDLSRIPAPPSTSGRSSAWWITAMTSSPPFERSSDDWKRARMTPSFDENLAKLGPEVPEASTPGANYIPYVLTGHPLYLAGQIPRNGARIGPVGKPGAAIPAKDKSGKARGGNEW